MGAFVFFSLLLALIAGAPRLERRLAPPSRASVLPVASGHAVLLEDSEGRVILEGVGGAHPDPEAHARLISSLLRARRLARLDAVVVSSTGSVTLDVLARSHDFVLRVARMPRRIDLDGTPILIDGARVRSRDLTITIEPPWTRSSSAAHSTARLGLVTITSEGMHGHLER